MAEYIQGRFSLWFQVESSNNKMSRGIVFAECTTFTLQVWYGPENLTCYYFVLLAEIENVTIEKVAHSTYGKSI